MNGIHIAETEETLVLTLEKSHVNKSILKQVVQYLEWQTLDISHIPRADAAENEEIAESLRKLSPKDRSIAYVETITL